MPKKQRSRKRSTNGEISIAVNDGKLRLHFPAKCFSNHQRKYLPLGIDDTPENKLKAELVIVSIKGDILKGDFDESLHKYRRSSGEDELDSSSIQSIWQEYLKYKQKSTKPTNYNYLSNNLGRYINRCPITDVKAAIEVREWLLESTTVFMAKRILLNLNAAIKWGIKNKKIDLKESPFDGMAAELPRHNWQQNPAPNAFTAEEMEEILLEFKYNENNHYRHYYDLILFLFSTGCRPSEAHGLRKQDIDLKRRSIYFNGSLARIGGKAQRLEGSKNNKGRIFPIDDRLLDLMAKLVAGVRQPEDFIFRSYTGLPIDHSYFCKAIWHPVVGEVIDRPSTPYSCRDTFITRQLVAGIAPATVCAWCDTSISVIQSRYLDPAISRSISPVPISPFKK